MAVSAKVYNGAITSLANKEIDWGTDDIKVALFTSALVVNQTTHRYFDVTPYTANQVTGTGYTAGGQSLTTKTEAYAGQVKAFNAAESVWSTATFTAHYAIIYDNTPASSKPLIAYIDFGVDVVAAGGEFRITWDSAGIFTVTVD